jgi:hypothetical protein
MAASESAALETAIATLTAGAPHELFETDTAGARKRLERELGRQLARLDDDASEDDVDAYLDETVFESDGEDIVVTDVYPRDAGMASGFTQALKALRLPSGAAVYYEAGEWEASRIRGVAAGNMDDEAAAAFGEVIALPTYFHAGGYLLEIDRHLSACTPDSWILEALVDHEAEWIDQEQLDEGEDRRAQLQEAIDESAEEGDINTEKLVHIQESLDATPPWFLLVTDAQLEEIAAYELPDPDHRPRLSHSFHPWVKPTTEMFLEPSNPANLQHIVAAYLKARI